MEHPVTIACGDIDLSATLHYPASGGSGGGDGDCRWPIVMICHGFVGNRIGPDRLFVKAARALSENGFMVLRFDYGGCGESTGDYGSGGLDRMIEETRSVIDYALDMDCVDPGQVTLLGHSLGGAVALLTAAADKRVKSLVLWSAVAQPLGDIVRIVGEAGYEEAMEHGATDYLGYRLTAAFFESLSNHHPLQQVKRFHGDVFLAHGTGDADIPSDYCFLYQRIFWMRSSGQCDKELILQANHAFSNGGSSQQLFDKTIDWLKYMRKRKSEWTDWII